MEGGKHRTGRDAIKPMLGENGFSVDDSSRPTISSSLPFFAFPFLFSPFFVFVGG